MASEELLSPEAMASLSTARATRALARLWHLTLEWQAGERGIASGLEPAP